MQIEIMIFIVIGTIKTLVLYKNGDKRADAIDMK